MDEACRQTVPLPQLLYVCDMGLETDVKRMEDVDGRLNAKGRITDLHPSAYGYHHDWDFENAGWISTEAFILPSATVHVYAEAGGAFWIRPLYDGHLPALCLKPPQEYASAFFWLKKIRVPATIHSSVFTAWSFGEDARLTLYFPNQFFWYGRKYFNPFMPVTYDHCG